MSNMTAYHSEPALKEATLAQMRAHREADQLVQGRYWDEEKGCAVGCLTHDTSGGHHLYPERWGIPVELARLEDAIFEALPPEDAQAWPERFLGAIPVGADLSLVWPHFAIWLLTDPEHGVARLGAREHCERVAALYERVVADDDPGREAFARAARAARAAWAVSTSVPYAVDR